MLRRPFLLSFTAALVARTAAAESPPVAQRQPDLPLGRGAILHRFTAGDDVEFTIVRFDSAHCTLRVIDQPDRSRATSLAKAMVSLGAIAGVNGGFFTPAFESLGLTVSQGNRAGSWQRSSLLGGVLVVKKGRPLLLWRDEFRESDGITELLQAGPRLVSNGQTIPGLESKSRRPRTFIATDNEGRWLAGTAVYTSLPDLARWLATPGLVPGMKIDRALNLDGGKSTGFWARASDGLVISEPEISKVRNFVAIVPRSRP